MAQQLNLLTCLRFFAATWVVAFDFAPSIGLGVPPFIGKGYLGVELFFVLSGFILCHVYLTAWGERRFRYREFLWARLARIYPVHLALLAALVAISILALSLGIDIDRVAVWSSLPSQLTLTQAWGLGLEGGWNHPAWSISAEWFAYLAFPLFAAAACWFRKRVVVGVVCALVVLVSLNTVFGWVAGTPLTRVTLAWGALRIVPPFFLGCMVWLAWQASPLKSGAMAMAAAVVAVAFVIINSSLGGPDWLSVAAFGGLIFSLASLDAIRSSRPASRTLTYLGEVSFSIYMVVMPVQTFAQQIAEKLQLGSEGVATTGFWLLAIIALLPLAMMLHHLVEKPARVFLRRSAPTKVAVSDKLATISTSA